MEIPGWEELLNNKRLIGGQLLFQESGNYVGEIQRIKIFTTHAVVWFEWAAYKTKLRGWTSRKRRCKTLRKQAISVRDDSYFVGDSDQLLFKGHPDPVKKSNVVAPLTHDDRQILRRQKRPLPLFDK